MNFKLIKEVFKDGGNYGFVAKNIATIYYILNNSEFGKELSQKQLLYATAHLDMFAYIINGKVSKLDLEWAVKFANRGIISIFGSSTFNTDLDPEINGESITDLVNLVMQLEALIFREASSLSSDVIIKSILSNKEEIEKMVVVTLNEGEKCSLYEKMFGHTFLLINEPNFKEHILSMTFNE